MEAVGVVGLVGDDVFGGQALDEIARRRHIVLLAWSQGESDRQAESVCAGMELGPDAATRAAERLGVRSPFFRRAPAAWA